MKLGNLKIIRNFSVFRNNLYLEIVFSFPLSRLVFGHSNVFDEYTKFLFSEYEKNKNALGTALDFFLWHITFVFLNKFVRFFFFFSSFLPLLVSCRASAMAND